MSDINAQKKIIQDVSSVGYITGALRDIAVVEMKGLRERFSRNGAFFDELRTLYELVWRIAELHTTSSVPSVQERANTLYVAYTTNKHFYGSLNFDVMEAFTKGTSSKDECLIIGTTGREMWRTATRKRKGVDFVTFADDTPNAQETRDFLSRAQDYEHVYVFYPGFVSVYQQSATMVDITFRPKKTPAGESGVSDMPEYFLEPDIKEMFAFFSTQVRYVLFERMLLETELSRVSARLVRMDVADHNAALMLKREQHELSRAYNSFANSRMLETLIGFTQWHRTNL